MAWFAGTLVITTKNLCSFFVNFMPSDVFNGPTHCLKMTVFTRKRPWKIVTTKRTSVLDRFREGAFLANFRARRLILVSRGNVCFGHWWTYITHIQYTRWFYCWDIFARNIDTGEYILGEYFWNEVCVISRGESGRPQTRNSWRDQILNSRELLAILLYNNK